MSLRIQKAAKTLFSAKDLDGRWPVCRATIARKMKAGEIRTVRFGARVLVPFDEVLRIDHFGLEPPKEAAHDKKA